MAAKASRSKKWANTKVEITTHPDSTIAIPKGMSLGVAAETLARQEIENNTVKKVAHTVRGAFAVDAVHAFTIAFERIIGRAFTPDGMEPAVSLTIPNGLKTTTEIKLGPVTGARLEGGFLAPTLMGSSTRPEVAIIGKVKAMLHDTVLHELWDELDRILAEESLYKGKAISLDLSWTRDENPEFNPEQCAPAFRETEDPDSLILTPETATIIESSVFDLIRHTDEWEASGLTVRRSVVLSGPYGTGKSKTCGVIGRLCEQNGWTCIHLTDARDIVRGYEIARQFEPACLIIEDLDTVLKGERSDEMNLVLNTIDGVDKSARVLFVATTNHLGSFNAAALRAGRIDDAIHLGNLDGPSAVRFLRLELGDRIPADAPLDTLEPVVAGMAPATLAEVSKSSIRRVFHRNPAAIDAVSVDDLIEAALAVAANQRRKADEASAFKLSQMTDDQRRKALLMTAKTSFYNTAASAAALPPADSVVIDAPALS